MARALATMLSLVTSALLVAGRPVKMDSNLKLPLHVKLDVLLKTNNSYVVKLEEWTATADNVTATTIKDYNKAEDDQGAAMYVCAVILMYGFSIVFMIGSLVKKSMSDQRVRRYMKTLSDVRRYERRMETYKASVIVSKKKRESVYTGSLCTVHEDDGCSEDTRMDGQGQHDDGNSTADSDSRGRGTPLLAASPRENVEY